MNKYNKLLKKASFFEQACQYSFKNQVNLKADLIANSMAEILVNFFIKSSVEKNKKLYSFASMRSDIADAIDKKCREENGVGVDEVSSEVIEKAISRSDATIDRYIEDNYTRAGICLVSDDQRAEAKKIAKEILNEKLAAAKKREEASNQPPPATTPQPATDPEGPAPAPSPPSGTKIEGERPKPGEKGKWVPGLVPKTVRWQPESEAPPTEPAVDDETKMKQEAWKIAYQAFNEGADSKKYDEIFAHHQDNPPTNDANLNHIFIMELRRAISYYRRSLTDKPATSSGGTATTKGTSSTSSGSTPTTTSKPAGAKITPIDPNIQVALGVEPDGKRGPITNRAIQAKKQQLAAQYNRPASDITDGNLFRHLLRGESLFPQNFQSIPVPGSPAASRPVLSTPETPTKPTLNIGGVPVI